MSKKFLNTLLTLTAFTVLANDLNAGTLVVDNQNRKEMVLEILPAHVNITDKFVLKQTIPANKVFVYMVESAAINNNTIYSVKGDTNMLTPGDKCKNLDVAKNYKLTFTDDKAGTTCVASELSEDQLKEYSKVLTH